MVIDVRSMAALDPVDQQIVQALVREGRQSVPGLAEAAGISRSSAYARVDALRARGVITGFGARIDHGAAGLGVAALVLVNVRQSEWSAIRRQMRDLPGVEWIGLAAGAFDFVLRVRAHDLAELRDVVLDRIQSLDDVRSAQTMILLDEEDCIE